MVTGLRGFSADVFEHLVASRTEQPLDGDANAPSCPSAPAAVCLTELQTSIEGPGSGPTSIEGPGSGPQTQLKVCKTKTS